jgi:hypothetical protein
MGGPPRQESRTKGLDTQGAWMANELYSLAHLTTVRGLINLKIS